MLKVVRTRYLDYPIRYKILLWFVPLLVITIAATGFYAYRIASSEITGKIEVEQLGSAKQAADHLDYIAQDAVDISNYLFLTPEIQAILRPNPAGGGIVTNQTVIDSINRLMVTRPYFQFLTMYSAHFAPIQFNNKGLSSAISFEEYRKAFDYDKLLARPEMETWSVEVPGRTTSVFYGDTKNKLLLTKVLKNNTNYKPEGVLLLGIDEMDIRRSYAPVAGGVEIAVVGKDGIVLSESTGEWIGRPASEMPYFEAAFTDPKTMDSMIDTSKWVYAHVESAVTGWHVLVVVPRSELLAQLNRIKWVTAAIAGITLLLALFVSWAVAGVITGPMRKILSSMKRFQKGNFSEQVELAGGDEIGQFGAGYNIMVQRIRELVDDVYSFELKQKQAELKVLQSQINPHFLYNTLNTIAWTAEKNGDRQVGDMIYALSGIFKLSLSQGRDVLELKQEFQLVEHYLFLQKMRFQDRLTYELELPPALGDFPIPKLILQPLVENAVVHGIEPLADELGVIQVHASAGEGLIRIELTDNGIGMSAERLQELLRMTAEGAAPPGSDSFALANVSNRIRMYYGQAAALDIQSVPGSGTRIVLELPDNGRSSTHAALIDRRG